MVDILIKNGLILADETSPIEKGYITIEKQRIKEIGKGEKEISAKEIIDAQNCIVSPGFINVHTHLPMAFMRGVGDDLPLEEWLKNYIWPLEGKFLSSEYVRDASYAGVAELLLSGTTTFCDMYFFEENIAEVVKETGIRGVLTPGILDFPTPYFKNAEDALHKAEMFIKNWEKEERIYTGIAPHSVYTCSSDIFKKANEISEKYNCILHTHISETKKEVEDSVKRFGTTPVHYLEKLNYLSPFLLAVHCVYMDDKEISLFSERGVKVAHAPESNLKLGSGIMRIKKFLENKITVGIGTDSVASNNDLDIIGEMRTCALVHKGVSQNPIEITAKEVFSLATIGGAKAIGIEKETGSIKIGKFADIVIIDMNHINVLPFYDPYSAIVYSTKSFQVRDVIVHGKILVRNRELKTIDIEKIKWSALFYKEKIQNALQG